MGYSSESWHCMILFTNHTTVMCKVAHSQQCIYMQYVLCNVMEHIKLNLWSWQRCFLRICTRVYFISWVSNTFLWMWLVTPSSCWGTFTMLLMTTVHLQYLYFERFLSHPSYSWPTDPTMYVQSTSCSPPQTPPTT